MKSKEIMRLINNIVDCAQHVEAFKYDLRDEEDICLRVAEGETREEIIEDIENELQHYLNKADEYKSKLQTIANEHERLSGG